jgi:hypothetical protein
LISIFVAETFLRLDLTVGQEAIEGNQFAPERGVRVRENSISKLSPEGTAENTPRRNPGQPSAVPAGLNHVA